MPAPSVRILRRSTSSNISSKVWRTRLCRTRSKLRSERLARRPCRLSESPSRLCRWRAVRPRRPRCRPRIRHPIIPFRRKLRSAKKKSPTSVWERSLSSTRKTPARLGSASNTPAVADAEAAAAAAAGAAEAAVAAAAAAAVAGAAAAAAACRGECAASANVQHVPITLTDAVRHGRVWIGPGHGVLHERNGAQGETTPPNGRPPSR